MSADAKTPIHVRKWIPDEEAEGGSTDNTWNGFEFVAWVFTVHLAYLTDHGYVVVGHDLLGMENRRSRLIVTGILAIMAMRLCC